MIFTATDGTLVGAKIVERRMAALGDLHNEFERLRGEFVRDDWVFAPRSEFDRLVGDISRLKTKVWE